MWFVGLFGDVYITTECFDKSVKPLNDVNIPCKLNNRADFVAQSFTGFKWILGYSTTLQRV